MNHGVDKDLLGRLFEESKKFFDLPVEEKMKLDRKEIRGYTPLYSEKLDTSLNTKGLICSYLLSNYLILCKITQRILKN